MDVFLSYAPEDDQPLLPGQSGWVDGLASALSALIGQRLGAGVELHRGAELDEPEALRRVGESALFVAVVSPSHDSDSSLARQLQEFFTAHGAAAGARIVLIVKSPVSRDRVPPILQGLYPHEFFVQDEASGRIEEFRTEFGGDASERFLQMTNEVALALEKAVTSAPEPAGAAGSVEAPGEPEPDAVGEAAEPPSAPQTAPANGRTIFLAETSSDLKSIREGLRSELRSQGFDLLPADRADRLPEIDTELIPALEEALAAADLSVHLVGAMYGRPPEGTDPRSVVEIQCDLAGETGKPRLIWIAPGVEPGESRKDPRHERLLASIKDGAVNRKGTKLLRGSVESLETEIRDTVKEMEEAARRAETSEERDRNYVFLICEEQDEEFIRPLRGFLKQKRVAVRTPGFKGDPDELNELFDYYLEDCDANLIYYGQAPEGWRKVMLMRLARAGTRRGQSAHVNCLYVMPVYTPENSDDKRQLREDDPELMDAGVLLLKGGEAFDPETIGPFLRRLEKGSEG